MAKKNKVVNQPKNEDIIRINSKYYIYIGLAIIVLIGIVYTYNSYSKKIEDSKPGQYDKFAQCITDTNARFYGAFWCPHCAQQKELFGNSMKYINYVECSNPDRSQNKVCTDANIEGYPTWEFGDGTRVSQVLPLDILALKTGCQLDTNITN